VVEGTAELPNVTSLRLLMTVPAFAEEYASMLESMKLDLQTFAADYSQPIRVTPTRFLA